MLTPFAPLPVGRADGRSVRVSALFRDQLACDLVRFSPTHVVSLIDPKCDRLPTSFPRQHLVLRMLDYEDDREGGPDAASISRLIEFLTNWSVGDGPKSQPLLVHCHMGARRSTAAAYIAHCILDGPDREDHSFASFLTNTNKPWPNRRIVKLASQSLNRGPEMVAAIDRYRERYPNRPAAYDRLNARRGVIL